MGYIGASIRTSISASVSVTLCVRETVYVLCACLAVCVGLSTMGLLGMGQVASCAGGGSRVWLVCRRRPPSQLPSQLAVDGVSEGGERGRESQLPSERSFRRPRIVTAS
mgnify:CR=1 FL=1